MTTTRRQPPERSGHRTESPQTYASKAVSVQGGADVSPCFAVRWALGLSCAVVVVCVVAAASGEASAVGRRVERRSVRNSVMRVRGYEVDFFI